MIQPFALKCPQTSVMPEGVGQKLKTLRLSLTLPFKPVFMKLRDTAYKSFCHCYEKRETCVRMEQCILGNVLPRSIATLTQS